MSWRASSGSPSITLNAPIALANERAIAPVPINPAVRPLQRRYPRPTTIDPASGKIKTSQAKPVALIP